MTTSTAADPPAGAPRRTGKDHVDSYGRGRVCEAPGCRTELSRYNATGSCWLHDKARSLLVSTWLH
jgi:hypothetical protein